jgi:hypothetical protein
MTLLPAVHKAMNRAPQTSKKHGEAVYAKLPVFTVKSGQAELWSSYLINVFHRDG